MVNGFTNYGFNVTIKYSNTNIDENSDDDL